MCNAYIAREQTEPWLVFPHLRKWFSSTFGYFFMFLVVTGSTPFGMEGQYIRMLVGGVSK